MTTSSSSKRATTTEAASRSLDPPTVGTRWSHGRVPGCELIENPTVAFELQRIQWNAAVEEQDQVTGRAPGGGVDSVRVLAGSGREAGGLCAVVGKPEAPGLALDGVVVDNGGFVWPGDCGGAEGELAVVEAVEGDLLW